jgi:hypothetical protein
MLAELRDALPTTPALSHDVMSDELRRSEIVYLNGALSGILSQQCDCVRGFDESQKFLCVGPRRQ